MSLRRMRWGRLRRWRSDVGDFSRATEGRKRKSLSRLIDVFRSADGAGLEVARAALDHAVGDLGHHLINEATKM